METKQTAVDWLIERWKKLQKEGEKMSWNQIIQITELAKALEKQQIVDAYERGDKYKFEIPAEQYYNETYKTE